MSYGQPELMPITAAAGHAPGGFDRMCGSLGLVGQQDGSNPGGDISPAGRVPKLQVIDACNLLLVRTITFFLRTRAAFFKHDNTVCSKEMHGKSMMIIRASEQLSVLRCQFFPMHMYLAVMPLLKFQGLILYSHDGSPSRDASLRLRLHFKRISCRFSNSFKHFFEKCLTRAEAISCKRW